MTVNAINTMLITLEDFTILPLYAKAKIIDRPQPKQINGPIGKESRSFFFFNISRVIDTKADANKEKNNEKNTPRNPNKKAKAPNSLISPAPKPPLEILDTMNNITTVITATKKLPNRLPHASLPYTITSGIRHNNLPAIKIRTNKLTSKMEQIDNSKFLYNKVTIKNTKTFNNDLINIDFPTIYK